MADSIRFSRDVPVRHSVDVCVVGAGPGGVAAAVFAARNGARTMILDAHTMAGGMSTAGRIPVLMSCSDGVNFLAGGFGSEVVAAMDAAGNVDMQQYGLLMTHMKIMGIATACLLVVTVMRVFWLRKPD